MRLPYSEGTIFLVPLRNSGHARGVVARASPEGKIVFGYFFGPRMSSSDSFPLEGIEPKKAMLRARFGDLGLINREWRIFGRMTGWTRSEWPMPDYVRRDLLKKKKPILVRYSDHDPSMIESETQIADDMGLANDSLAGYGAIEVRLTKLLSD